MKHFFDVGANVGQTFDDYLTRDPSFDGCKIWCFEPSPRHLLQLMNKAASFGSRYDIRICPFGLRGTGGVTTFFQKDDPRGDSFEHYLASDHETSNLSPGYSLHAYAAGVSDFILTHTEPGDEIVLKLDCEGSEYELLSCLIGRPDALTRIRQILVEWHTIKSEVPIYGEKELSSMFAEIGFPLERWMF